MTVGTKCFLWMGEKKVGEFVCNPQSNQNVFRYSDNWVKEGFPLSPVLPFSSEIKDSRFFAFLENFLPEGRALEHLSRLNSLSKNNVLGLCLAIKSDLAGALVLSSEDFPHEKQSCLRPVTGKEIFDRLNFPDTNPMDIWDGKPRLSVAGIQTKLNVLKLDEQYSLVDGKDLCSTHILKFDSFAPKNVLLNEFLTMGLARTLGFPVALTKLKRIGSHRLLEVERFDRKIGGTGEAIRVYRRYVIDACQSLGLTSSFKYEQNLGNGRDVAHIRDGVSLEKLFSLIRYAKDPLGMRRNLLTWTIFNLVIGNSDAHGKNFSFFVDQSGLSPTPWYDLVSVIQIPDVQHSMAMSIGDEFEIEHIHALQILYEAQKCDLEFSLVQKILSQVLNKLSEALNRFEIPSDCDDEEREFCSTYSQSIELRIKKWSDELKLLPQLAEDSSLF